MVLNSSVMYWEGKTQVLYYTAKKSFEKRYIDTGISNILKIGDKYDKKSSHLQGGTTSVFQCYCSNKTGSVVLYRLGY